MRGIKKWYCADTETSNSEINIRENYTRVWLWDLYDPETRKHLNGFDISSFFKTVFSLKACVIYFHNLKFDGSFMLDYLLSNGFRISDGQFDGAINTMITDRNVWYQIIVYYNNKKYEFRDSLKKITSNLRAAAKSFGLSYGKGEIDYKKHRDKGYKATPEEIEYIHIDTEIMGDILKEFYDQGLTAMTNATDAMKQYKKIITPTAYAMYYPKVTREVDDFIRRSYKGGFCYLNPKHKGKELHEVYTYDVKSMYPSVMTECLLPFGQPEYFEGKYKQSQSTPLFIQEIYIDCKLKEGHIPTIQRKKFMMVKLDYLIDTHGERINLVLTSVDLENLYNDYDIFEIEYVQGYAFRAADYLFKDYVEKFFKLKESSTGAKKQIYKIFLNSLYGKFAMAMERCQKIPRVEDGILKFINDDSTEVDSMYTAVASFITAYARQKLLKAIRANVENFIYCDTDSIHLTAPAIEIAEGNNLGQFAIENGYYVNGKPVTEVKLAKYIGQKCYFLLGENIGGAWEKKKIAGCTDELKKYVTFENFSEGLYLSDELEGKFCVKQAKGGVLLVPTHFEIKDR